MGSLLHNATATLASRFNANIMTEAGKKHVADWFYKECVPVYGLIIISVVVLSFFVKPSWDFSLALLSALVSTDVIGASFCFLYAALFAIDPNNLPYKTKIIVGLFLHAILYVLMKIYPVSLPKASTDYNVYFNGDIWKYAALSVSSLIWTLMTMFRVKRETS